LGEKIEKIILRLSPNIIKNAMGVGIPGTREVGIHIAAALGFLIGDEEAGLQVLANVKEGDVIRAKEFINQGLIQVEIANNPSKLYISSEVIGEEHQAKVIIEGSHTNIVLIEKDHQTLYTNDLLSEEFSDEDYQFGIRDIYHFIQEVNYEDIQFILEGAFMNKRMAMEGLDKDYGLKVGKTMQRSIDSHLLSDDMKNYAIRLTAAASDARMDGCMSPVMTNSGSGNQGITVTLPVVAVAEWTNQDDEKLARALILSHLVAIHIKKRLGRLSALCGAIAAAIGSGCGMTYLMDGSISQIFSTIKNIIGDVSGMICDGAKTGCALKVATVVESAFNAMLLSLNNIEISKDEGIIDDDIEKSISNLTYIGSKGMEETDKMILDIMIKKSV
jgi:L-cysteine desulfidase